MEKALIITEKPSVSRDIAAALGGFTEHEGYFESDTYFLTFAVGHLFELLAPEDVDPVYKSWTLDNLPILPERFQVKPKSGQSERIRTIKKLITRDDVNRVVNACDAGREGELIFREIISHFGIDKPIERLWLQSMTPNAIRMGFESLRPGEELQGLADAAACRSYSDWLIGMNATRALTKRLKSRRERTAWSAGRVQTPTLALLVDRELEVLAHVPKPYWRVQGTFDHQGAAYTGTWFDSDFTAGEDEHARDDRIFDEARATAIVEAVQGQAGSASETRKPSRESAPPLFDLTSLQREGNRRFGWSARRTLSAAQRLYEGHKLLTYPRTDSRCLPNDYRDHVANVLSTYAALPDSEFAESAAHLQSAGLQNEARIFDDAGVSDHFAIIPTGQTPDPSISGDDKRLFDLVMRRFLGAFHPPAVWERVERVTEVANQRFRTRARTLQEPGWRAVLAEDREDEVALPPLAPGQTEASGVAVGTTGVESEADETKPPARITEARLLSLMENAGKQIEDEDIAAALGEKGLGTPATRADVIENLIGKGYALRSGKALRPSVKGIRLIDILRRIQIDRLASAELTGELEQHLIEVEHGTRTATQFMTEITDYTKQIVERAKTFGYEELYEHDPPLGDCPSCGRPVYERAWFYRCNEVEGAEEDCPMRFWKDTSGRYLDREAVRQLLADGKTHVLEGFTARTGRTYKGHIELNREEWKLKVRSAGWSEGEGVSDAVEYDVNTEPLAKCPFDEECKVVESPTHFICERTLKAELVKAEKGKEAEGAEAKAKTEVAEEEQGPKSCGFSFPRTVCKREITREEADVYLQNRRTDLLTDFTSRMGRPFSATLVLRDNGRHGFEFPPRAPRAGKAGAKKAGKKAGTKKAGAKKAGKKAATKKAAKKAGSKKAATKKAGAKKAGAKKATRRKVSAKKAAPSSDESDS